ncbi:hypothetical protein H4219_004381 [Mycoemilia scoparia]|uniref:DH domain-containing protein n=1 Tax=Mycoemilia scoparia TaxID=417184 RepID=A0A9W8DR89_9FUNG|nr:hypothetical protein H4219_004381 [Mycoemilia scoparia]
MLNVRAYYDECGKAWATINNGHKLLQASHPRSYDSKLRSSKSPFQDVDFGRTKTVESILSKCQKVDTENILETRFDDIQCALQELSSSEKAYVFRLALITKHFIKPLSSHTSLDQSLVRKLIQNLPAILELHQDFFELIERSIRMQSLRLLSTAFDKMTDQLDRYAAYCEGYLGQLRALRSLRSNPSWSKFMTEVHRNMKTEPEGGKLELNDYLIMPIQRVCKYPLLLGEILKRTDHKIPGYMELCLSLDALMMVCIRINARKSRLVTDNAALAFMSRFYETKDLPISTVKGFGEVVLSGPLMVTQGSKDPEYPKLRGCALFSKILIIFIAKNESAFIAETWFPLDDVVVLEHSCNPSLGHSSWRICCRNSGYQYDFRSASAAEKQVWVRNLRRCIQQVNLSVSGDEAITKRYSRTQMHEKDGLYQGYKRDMARMQTGPTLGTEIQKFESCLRSVTSLELRSIYDKHKLISNHTQRAQSKKLKRKASSTSTRMGVAGVGPYSPKCSETVTDQSDKHGGPVFKCSPPLATFKEGSEKRFYKSEAEQTSFLQFFDRLRVSRHLSLSHRGSSTYKSKNGGMVTGLLMRSKSHGKNILTKPFSRVQSTLSGQTSKRKLASSGSYSGEVLATKPC